MDHERNRQTDRQDYYCNTALCTILHRVVIIYCVIERNDVLSAVSNRSSRQSICTSNVLRKNRPLCIVACFCLRRTVRSCRTLSADIGTSVSKWRLVTGQHPVCERERWGEVTRWRGDAVMCRQRLSVTRRLRHTVVVMSVHWHQRDTSP